MPIVRREALPVVASLVKRQARARGPVESKVLNDTLDELHVDEIAIINALNRFFGLNETSGKILTREIATLRDRVAELERHDAVRQYFDAENGATLEFVTDFRDLTPLQTTQFPAERRLRVNPLYGQVTVPYNNYRSRFHLVDVRRKTLFVPPTLVLEVSDVNEGGGAVTPGTPAYAFNGQNESYWQRSVEFDLANNIDRVSMQMDIDVPLDFAQKANVLTINPYPVGQVDIVDIRYSVDASAPSLQLPGFPTNGINNAKFTRFFFPPTDITKLRIRFRQRNWVERDGRKLFNYGAQEIDLSLVEFDKTNEASAKDNNGLVLKIDCPEGFKFNQITNFFSDPAWEVAGSPSGVYFELYSDESLSTLQWTSLTDPDPQATPIDLSALAISTVYLVVALKYQTDEQNTPVLSNLGFAYTVTT